MTAFSLLMLGKLVFLVFCCFFAVVTALYLNPVASLSFFFSFFSIIKTVCFDCSYFTTAILTRGDINIFRLLRQVSTRCLLAKALSFWREERSH